MEGWDVLVGGVAEGEVLELSEPLSFWGGLDIATGKIIDSRHPQYGQSLTGKIVVMPFARGSSSSANTLAESIHFGTGPAAVLLEEPDEIVVLGALVPGEIYGEWRPVVVIDRKTRADLRTGAVVKVSEAGLERIGSDGL